MSRKHKDKSPDIRKKTGQDLQDPLNNEYLSPKRGKTDDFWYRLGLETGGPLYQGLIQWLDKKLNGSDKKILFLAPGGNVLYRLLKKLKYQNIEYIEIFDEKIQHASVLKQYDLTYEDFFVFDAGWDGSSQTRFEETAEHLGTGNRRDFLYFGILNTEKSRKQLHGKRYDTYAFNFFTNYGLQRIIEKAPAVAQLFFTGLPGTEGDEFLKGIFDFLETALPESERNGQEIPPYLAMEPLDRLLSAPTAEEAKAIGDVSVPDDPDADETVNIRKIAFASEKEANDISEIPVLWIEGLLARDDIPESLKTKIASNHGMVYPKREDNGYHLEDETSLRNYSRWMQWHEKHPEEIQTLTYHPLFSVVIPVYNTKTEQLKAAVDSVLAQTYKNFELILVDDHSSWKNVVPVLRFYENHSAVQVIYRQENGHISAATNDGIQRAKGDFIVFMDCDDMITENALYEVALKLNEDPYLDFIYSDEDKITEDGKVRHMPAFKPEWSPDLFWSMMYTNHLGVYRASIVKELGGLRSEFNGSQDYDMTLRFLEKTGNNRVGHIAKVLYHWRERVESAAYKADAKNYAIEAAKNAKLDALKRRRISGHLEYTPGTAQYRVIYEVENAPLVSIVIPSKDHPDVLSRCIDSLTALTTYTNYEIIVVDNGSSRENRASIENYLKEKNARYIYGKYDFNFSKMCNFGADAAKGDFLLFLNDDIEIIQPDWLERMLGQAQQSHTGAVGAKLLYPETTMIQHAGVSNLNEGPDHNFLRLDDKNPYYFGYNWVNINCCAVTAACLLVKKSIFEEVDKFNENLPVAYNDVDLCWKIHEAGYYNVVRNDAAAYHHESLSRGNDLAESGKLMRLRRERMHLLQEHPAFKDGDPFLNPHLHKYAAVLDLKNHLDEVKPAEMPEGTETGFAALDVVWRMQDQVMIHGWSCVSECKDNSKLKRCLFLEDPYGNCFQADPVNVHRPDVAKALKRDDLLNCGYECIVDPEIIRTDIMSYRLTIVSVDPDGRTYLTKLQKETGLTPVYASDLITNYNKIVSVGQYQAPGRTDRDNMYFVLEQCEVQEEALVIRGWGYCEGNRHYLYKPYIILRDENGVSFQFEAERQFRLDVANELPYVHYLNMAGFRCVINTEELPVGHVYDVVMRMVNCLEKDDVREWTFEHQVDRFSDSKLERRIQKLQQMPEAEKDLTKELLALNAQKSETISLLIARLKDVSNEKEKQDIQICSLIRELDDSKRKYDEIYRELDDSKRKYDEVNREHLALMDRAEKVEEAFQIISNSNMWRITAPARKILDFVKIKLL